MKAYALLSLGALLGLLSTGSAQVVKVPAGAPVNITVTPAAPASPPVSITLGGRHGHVTPHRTGFTHTGGGNIDIQQPAADTVIITMTGVCVAGPHPFKNSVATMDFDLKQAFEVAFDNPKVKKAKVTLEARVIGLLRGSRHGAGSSEFCEACATVSGQKFTGMQICVPPHGVGSNEFLSLNCHEGPQSQPITPGNFALDQRFRISAQHSCGLCGKAVSAEFAPDPALDPLWISYWEPFHGAAKKDFGFQVILKVAED